MAMRHVHAFGLGAIVAGALAGVLVLLTPSRRIANDRHMAQPSRLAGPARTAVASQMRAHADGMRELVSEVTLLDYAAVDATTRRLLAEPQVSRPVSGNADELNAAFPARFFQLQDELRGNLEALQKAAAARQPDALADAFGAASRTCVRCHDAYLTGR